jgi:hypothetical protein
VKLAHQSIISVCGFSKIVNKHRKTPAKTVEKHTKLQKVKALGFNHSAVDLSQVFLHNRFRT